MQQLEVIEVFHEQICPWIIGNSFAKKVVAMQMFSNPNEGEKLHILMVGDPASGKSEIMDFVASCVPRGSSTQRKVSPVGMFEKLISCDGGIVTTDEFDKIDRSCREMMLECMQSQTLSEDKHQIHIKRRARTNILAGCNPVGNILTDEPLYLQVNYPLPLLTRFHMLIPFRQIDAEFYGEVAVTHNRYKQEELIDDATEKIKEYICEVRGSIPKVQISETMTRNIGVFIRDLKRLSSLGPIISPRTIEGFVSFLKARTRMNLRKEPDKEDFEYVKSLYEVSYK